jgi:hypothetical protein
LDEFKFGIFILYLLFIKFKKLLLFRMDQNFYRGRIKLLS